MDGKVKAKLNVFTPFLSLLWKKKNFHQNFRQNIFPFYSHSKLNFLLREFLVFRVREKSCSSVLLLICFYLLTLLLNNWFLCLSRILNNLKTFLKSWDASSNTKHFRSNEFNCFHFEFWKGQHSRCSNIQKSIYLMI